MSNGGGNHFTRASVSSALDSQPRPPIVVDPALAAIIGDPAAPSAVPPEVALPRCLPGERPGLVRGVRAIYQSIRHGVAELEASHARYGEIYASPYGLGSVVLVWDPHEIQRILRNEGNAWSAALGWDSVVFRALCPEPVSTGSLLSLDFAAHQHARKLVQPAFTPTAIRGYTLIAARAFEQTVTLWLADRHVDFKAAARKLLAEVSVELFTGISEPSQVALIDRALTDFWQGPQAIFENPRWSPKLRRAQRGMNTLRDFFASRVAERRERPGIDLFSHMCQAENTEGLSDSALISLFLTIMFGAFDTTSLAVTSMAYLLARHPIWQERLRQEARQIPADDLDATGLAKLERAEWVWKETLRLMPIGGSLPRRTLREVDVLGYKLPPGAFVGPVTGGLGRHPKYWQRPRSFDPERFSPQRAEDKKNNAYVPFGGGMHMCVGMQLANIEAKLLFHQLLTRCRFELTPNYQARHTFTPLGCVSGKVRLKLTPLA